MLAQLDAAASLGFEAIFWTEHDWRMSAHGYAGNLPLAGPETPGVVWEHQVGDPAREGGEHEAMASGPDGSAAMRLTATGEGPGRHEHRLRVSVDKDLTRTSLQGQTWEVGVYLDELAGRSQLTLELTTSRRPAWNGNEAGPYKLTYRFADQPAPPEVIGRNATFTIQLPLRLWSTATLRPVDDLGEAWPGLDGRDASAYQIDVAAAVRGKGRVSGYMDEIRISRDGVEGQAPLTTQHDLMSRGAAAYPQVHQFQALELSNGGHHVCWYGGGLRLPEADAQPVDLVPEVAAAGGVASYGHPFGVGSSAPDPGSQDELLNTVAPDLLAQLVHGCHALEVGYRQRGGATLATHESLWDACSRRGILLTGLGVNDNHTGTGWDTNVNNFATWLWADDAAEEPLLFALHAGRAYLGDPTKFAGALDIASETGGRMGSMARRPGPETKLHLLARALPIGSELEVLQLEMAADATPIDPETTIVDRIPATAQEDHAITIRSAADCLVRTRVRDASGEVVALSNPLWLVANPEDHEIPASRRA